MMWTSATRVGGEVFLREEVPRIPRLPEKLADFIAPTTCVREECAYLPATSQDAKT